MNTYWIYHLQIIDLFIFVTTDEWTGEDASGIMVKNDFLFPFSCTICCILLYLPEIYELKSIISKPIKPYLLQTQDASLNIW